VPERGEWVTLAPLEAPVLPALESLHEGWAWHPRTVAAWDAWRLDPVTAQFGPAEVAAAVELAWLTDEFASGNVQDQEGEERVGRFDRVSASELRLRMDGLGLSLKGKRDLRLRVAAEVEQEPEKPQLAEVRRIRAVV
jgi:hypothetical protein